MKIKQDIYLYMKSFLVNCFYFIIVIIIMPSAYAANQCIVAPKRIYACDNLIYTSIKKQKENQLVCLCKTDKESILTLLSKDDIATQRIIIRKFLSKHQLSSDELKNILTQIN